MSRWKAGLSGGTPTTDEPISFEEMMTEMESAAVAARGAAAAEAAQAGFPWWLGILAGVGLLGAHWMSKKGK